MTFARRERQRALLEHLSERGTGSIAALCKQFDVSEMTIRRDLSELEKEGHLVRTHGGAKLMESSFFEVSFADKNTHFIHEKKRIAQAAAQLVADGDSIIIDSGTTTGYFARELTERRVTVVTNALNVAADLIDSRQIDIHFSGGALRRVSVAAVGLTAARFFESYRCDRFFMGVEGIDEAGTLTVPDVQEALVKQNMMRAAREIVILADHSKLGRNSLGVIGSLEQVSTLITSREANQEIVTRLERYTRVITV
ncbi:DeoR/GlpR family DNA-binding transcription regulator [Consotaella aegiceratis]|uniref:DeoR/GlpR family DNA-binding transcription regulator n=1 Tax=Consotaella aegiceratis TaxID=3097961 RepID=UPI002F42CC72